MTEGKPPKDNGCGFLVAWAYLMILSVTLAPVVAELVTNALYAATGEERP